MIYPANYEEYHALLADDAHAIGALLRIYQFQTADEQQVEATKYQNNVGFNGVDSTFASSLAKQYLAKGYLSPKQLNYLRKIMPKYHGQICKVGFEPANNKPIEQKQKSAQEETFKKISLTEINDTKKILIKFSFPRGDQRFRESVNMVKTLKGRSWKPDLPDKPWICNLNIDNYNSLIDFGFEPDDLLKKWHESIMGTFEGSGDLQIPGLKVEPWPFQRAGISFLDNRDGCGIIGDDMGLGKTLQAIGYLQLHPELRPAVIVCPANVKGHWVQKVTEWMDNPTVYLLSGYADPEGGVEQISKYKIVCGNPKNRIIICNYDILANRTAKIEENGKTKKVEIVGTGWSHWLKKSKFQIIIGDEGHYIKNKKSGRSTAYISLAKKTKKRIFLSGTPIEKRANEFFNMLNLVAQDLFPSHWEYAMEYTDAHHNGYGWSFSGAKNREKLFGLINNRVMIRRMKTDVIKDLPKKIKSVMPMEIDNRAEYNFAESNFIRWIKDNFGLEAANKATKAEALVQFEKLKQLALKGKLDSCISWVHDVLESGEKLVVFCHHKEVVDRLMQEFGTIAVKIDGGTDPKDRLPIVERFNSNESIRLFIGTLAAREGISLKGASHLAFLELYWSPGKHDQAEDRIIGIGRGKEGATSVNIYYLLAENTVEIDIAKIIDKERKNVTKILDGKEVDEKDILTELMSQMLKEAA